MADLFFKEKRYHPDANEDTGENIRDKDQTETEKQEPIPQKKITFSDAIAKREEQIREGDQTENKKKYHEEALQAVKKFQNRLENREYLSQSDLADYRRAIERYATSGNLLWQTYKNQGYIIEEENERKWQETLRSLTEDYNQVVSFYSNFQNAEDYDEQLRNMERTEKMLTEDTQLLQKELEELQDLEQNYALNEQQLREYLLNPGIQNISEHQAEAISRWMDEKQYQYGFSDLAALNANIGEMRNYLVQVKRLQERTELEAVADPNSDHYDPEFEAHSGYRSTKVAQWEKGYFDTWNPDFYGSQQSGELNSGYGDTVYEFINGNTDVSEYLAGVENNYGYLEESEKKVYNYYYSKYGRTAAEEYLYKLEELLNQRAAKASFERLKGKTGQELMFAVAAGLDQFAYGLESLGNTEGKYKAPSKKQYLSQMVREDLQDDTLPVWYNYKSGQWESTVLGNSVGQIAYDMISTTANMAPAMVASAAVGAVSKTGGMLVNAMLLGTSAGGNAYQEKLNAGYSQEEASAYGCLVGLSESALEAVASGAGKIAKGALQYLDDVGVVLEELAESAGGKIFLNMGQEAMEEGVQTILEPYMWEAVSGEKMTVDKQEVLYNSLLGFITGGFTESSSAVVSRGVNLATGETSLSNEGLGLSPNEQRLFDKYQRQLDQYSRTEALLEAEKTKLQQEIKGGNEVQQGITRWNIKRLEKLLEQKSKKLDVAKSDPALKSILENIAERKANATQKAAEMAQQSQQNEQFQHQATTTAADMTENTEGNNSEKDENSRGKGVDISKEYAKIIAENHVITDGSHMENGKLKANVIYQTGEHSYIYKTNSDGLIEKVYVDALQEKTHDERLEHDRNTYGKQAGDHAGHLIGDRFGGSPALDNLVSQSALVNLSTYKKIENQWGKALKLGKKVSVEITVNYDSGGARPSSFTVEYTIDGEYTKRVIDNK